MRKTVDMLLASVSPCPMKTWMPLTLCVALAACSARAAAPRPDAGSATDAAAADVLPKAPPSPLGSLLEGATLIQDGRGVRLARDSDD